MITAYHGSTRTFDRFDLSKYGEGDGRSIGGWGIYCNVVPEIAWEYAVKGGGVYELRIIESDGTWLDLDEPLERGDHSRISRILSFHSEDDYDTFMSEYADDVDITGQKAYDYLAAVVGSQEQASRLLMKYGYLGTTFLDRGTMVVVALKTNKVELLENGKGRNYVVFDPNTIQIINFIKYEDRTSD